MNRLAQGPLANLRLRPWMVKMAFATFPPLLGAHIRLVELSPDFRKARVAMRQRLSNTTLWGAHFGGSLFAMTDSIYALLLKQNLGPEYVVWDKSASIEFVRPGRGEVFCEFSVEEAQLAAIRAATQQAGKCEPLVAVQVMDRRNEVVAEVSKTLYVRRIAPLIN